MEAVIVEIETAGPARGHRARAGSGSRRGGARGHPRDAAGRRARPRRSPSPTSPVRTSSPPRRRSGATSRSRPSKRAPTRSPVGAVVRTDPPAGTMVPRDSVVTMFISAGSPITTVPDVVGLTQSAASDRLTNAGLIMDVAVRQPVERRPAHRDRDHAGPGGRSEGRRRPHRHRRGRPGDRWREHDDVPERRGSTTILFPPIYLTWLRKFANSWCPPTVSTDSGWNCTPSTACSR